MNIPSIEDGEAKKQRRMVETGRKQEQLLKHLRERQRVEKV